MPNTRKPRTPKKKIYLTNPAFEERVEATLQAQDRMMSRIEEKLEKPVLNGGFDTLVEKVEKIESMSEATRDAQAAANTKIDAIHIAVYDPDKGLYMKVKDNTKWIENANKGLKWFAGLLIAGGLTGVGKLLYDVLTKHISFTP